MAQAMLEAGFTRVYVLKGGWDDWYEAGYPTEQKKPAGIKPIPMNVTSKKKVV